GGEVKIKNSTSELAPGVDVRGDGGMVVAPPTHRADGQYRWLNDFAIAEVPPWLLALVIWQPPPPRVYEPHDDASISSSLIAAMLVVINPDIDHHSWIQIGSALYSELGDTAGFAAWDNWSSRGSKYPGTHDLYKHWDCIVGADGYNATVGTLYHFA